MQRHPTAYVRPHIQSHFSLAYLYGPPELYNAVTRNLNIADHIEIDLALCFLQCLSNMYKLLALLQFMTAIADAALPPSGVDVARSSNVVWTDPTWASDGSGAMPIGNGDATSSVWVDSDTGDLRLLLSKSDVFDETSQPVHTGVLRVAFDPPLWQKGTPGHFKQTLDLPTSTVSVSTPLITVSVAFDLNAALRDGVPHQDAAVLHIKATSKTSSSFGVKVTVEPYRVEGAKSALGAGLCAPGVEHADTVVDPTTASSLGLTDTVTWYHYNQHDCEYFNTTISNQGSKMKSLVDHTRIWK